MTGKGIVTPLLNEAPYQEHTGFLTLGLHRSGQLHAVQSLEASPPKGLNVPQHYSGGQKSLAGNTPTTCRFLIIPWLAFSR